MLKYRCGRSKVSPLLQRCGQKLLVRLLLFCRKGGIDLSCRLIGQRSILVVGKGSYFNLCPVGDKPFATCGGKLSFEGLLHPRFLF